MVYAVPWLAGRAPTLARHLPQQELLKLSASAWDGLSRARLLRTVEDRRLETPSHGNLRHSTTGNDVGEPKTMALGVATAGLPERRRPKSLALGRSLVSIRPEVSGLLDRRLLVT